MGQVTISGNTLTTYGSQPGAKTYHSFNINGQPYTDAETRTKDQALATATRWMETLGLTDPDTGAEIVPVIDDTGVPEEVQNGAYELQLALINEPDLFNRQQQSGNNIKQAGAGSAAVTFFRPEDGLAVPKQALRWLSPYLGGDSQSYGLASGACGDSSFTDSEAPGLDRGYP